MTAAPTPRTRPRRARALTLAALALLPLSACSGPARTTTTTAPAPTRVALPLTDQQRADNLQSFDLVWTTVRDEHFDPNLNGVDWNAVRDELRPRVAAAASMSEARALMNDALGRLGQTHFAIIPAEAYAPAAPAEPASAPATTAAPASGAPSAANAANPESPVRARRGTLGFDLRVVDDQALVVRVPESGPAFAAGVRPGWTLLSVRGREVQRAISTLRESGVESHGRDPAVADAWARATEAMALNAATQADEGQPVPLVFLDDRAARRELTLTAAPAPGQLAPAAIGLPETPVDFHAATLPSGVLYTRLNIFVAPNLVMPAFAQAIQSATNAPGVIIDLRGNPGGLGLMAMGMAGWFIEQQGINLGTLKARGLNLNFFINPRAQPFQGKLAILVDELSMSTSEILAGGLQALGRARVFGAQTPGAALPSRIVELPNADRFQYAFANYISASGEPLEGKGVKPDVTVPLSRQAFSASPDPVLDAAVAWITSLPPAAAGTR